MPPTLSRPLGLLQEELRIVAEVLIRFRKGRGVAMACKDCHRQRIHAAGEQPIHPRMTEIVEAELGSQVRRLSITELPGSFLPKNLLRLRHDGSLYPASAIERLGESRDGLGADLNSALLHEPQISM